MAVTRDSERWTQDQIDAVERAKERQRRKEQKEQKENQQRDATSQDQRAENRQ